MKAAVLDVLGQTPTYAEFTEPDVQPGEQLVHVRAAAIKQLERLIASGKHYSSPRSLPIVPGLDGVGNAMQQRTPAVARHVTPRRKRRGGRLTRQVYLGVAAGSHFAQCRVING